MSSDVLADARRKHQAFATARVLWERNELDAVAFLREAFVTADQVPALIAEVERLRGSA